MKKRIVGTLLCVLLAGALWVSPAGAIGLGAYVSGGSGSSTWEIDFDDGTEAEVDLDSSHGGVGFVMDTNVAANNLFNYRLNLGYEKVDHKPGEGVQEFNLKGVVLDQDFGFGVVRTRPVRVWVGPELRLAYYTGEIENVSDFKIDLLEVGLGPVIGVNLNFGRVVTLSLKGGYLFTWMGGRGQDDNSINVNDADYTVTGGHAFGNVSILFRINDTY